MARQNVRLKGFPFKGVLYIGINRFWTTELVWYRRTFVHVTFVGFSIIYVL